MRGNFVTPRKGKNNPRYIDGRKSGELSRLYRIYNNMKSRCLNPNTPSYKNYGARGISIYKPWIDSFQLFVYWSLLNGYDDNLTIDRIDVNGNYTPDNCRWVTSKKQANNTRRTHFVTLNGETKSLKEWSDYYNINYKTVRDRLFRGWTYEDALTKEVVK